MKDSINVYEEERPWGKFRKFTENVPSTVKVITVNPNKKLSLQSHKKRSEFWKVISGGGVFRINEDEFNVSKDDEEYVPQGAVHRIQAGGEGISVLEIALGEFDENDITRFEDDFGRV